MAVRFLPGKMVGRILISENTSMDGWVDMRKYSDVLILLLGVLFSSLSTADAWKRPVPFGIISENMDYVVRISPGDKEKSIRAKADVFRFTKDRYGQYIKIDLTNEIRPILAFVNNRGFLATVENWYNSGLGKVIVIYDEHGKIASNFELKDLYGSEKAKELDGHWICFSQTPEISDNYFSLWDFSGGKILINLRNGQHKYIDHDISCSD